MYSMICLIFCSCSFARSFNALLCSETRYVFLQSFLALSFLPSNTIPKKRKQFIKKDLKQSQNYETTALQAHKMIYKEWLFLIKLLNCF